MSKVLVNETSLTAIGDAIRSKNGTEDKYKPSEMAAAISAISVGSGGDGLVLGGAVTAIIASAFEGDEGITSVSIPESVVSIGASAFSGCTNITDVYYNAAVSDLDYTVQAFRTAGQGGDGIKVVIGNKVTRVPSNLFNGGSAAASYAPNVKSIEFEDGSVCTEIGESAFYYNSYLESFVAPPTLEKIEGCGLFLSFVGADSLTLDFSACLQIPVLTTTYSVQDGNKVTIYVPAALYDEWIVATNWSQYADKIVAK